jgi:hypothetical protein
MGKGKKVESKESNKEIVAISMDQMYVDDENKGTKSDNSTEAASISMAKKAATEFVKKHPETQKFEKVIKKNSLIKKEIEDKKAVAAQAKVVPKLAVVVKTPELKKEANVEIDLNKGIHQKVESKFQESIQADTQ